MLLLKSSFALALIKGGLEPYSYIWSDPNGNTYTSDSLSIYSSLTGIYKLIVIDALGCMDSTNINVKF